MWDAGTSGSQLLFIFPTRVDLTTITLHYYSGNGRGLPRLRFYVVPDDSDVWNAPTFSYSRVDIAAVPPGEDPAGLRNFSVNFNFVNTKKILMYKFSSSFILAVSEVEFFTNCSFPAISNTMTTTTANTAYSKSSWTTVPHSVTDQLDDNTTTVKLQTSPASTTTTGQSSWHTYTLLVKQL